jgi:hypothetical protein
MTTPSLAQNLFNALDDEQKMEMYEICYDWHSNKCREEAKLVELTDTEKSTAKNHKVKTIMAVKNRLNCSVIVAKYAVDRFLGVEE